MIIDGHTHIIAADRDRYPFRREAGGGLRWPDEHPLSVEGLIDEMDNAGVDAAVVVQASVYGSDNRYVVESAEDNGRLVAIAIVDIEDGSAEEVDGIVDYCAQRGCGGVRLFDVPPSAPSFLDDGRATAVARKIDAAGGRVCVCALETALAKVASLAASIPDMTLVLEHCGFADFSGGPPFVNAQPLFHLATYPGVILKVTTTSLLEAEKNGIEACEVVKTLAERFGGERLMWGSDFPQHHVEPYAALVEKAHRSAVLLDESARTAYLGGTAARLWPTLIEGTT